MAAQLDPFNLVGTIVDGRYRIERIAGRGGFGIVYRAYHLGFEWPVALKVLKMPQRLDAATTGEQLARFKREGKVLFELCSLHPCIVKASETGTIASSEHGALPYLALEWLDGVSLDQELRFRRQHGIAPMTLPEVLCLLDEAATAMALAHARGVAHRDIKPSNLFVSFRTGKPVVKILDFGIAKILDVSAGATTQFETTGAAPSSFTPMYAAPEQWLRRLGATGTWTDVHAWALVCLELLTGRSVLTGDDSAQYMAAALDASVRPTPSNVGLDVAVEVEAAFSKAVALEPRDRFPNLGEFWAALSNAAASSTLTSNGERTFPFFYVPRDEGPHSEGDRVRTSQPSTTSLPTPTLPTRTRIASSAPRRVVTLQRAMITVALLGALGLSLGAMASLGNSPSKRFERASVAAAASATAETQAEPVGGGTLPVSAPIPPVAEHNTPSPDSTSRHNGGAVRPNVGVQEARALSSQTRPAPESPPSVPAIAPSLHSARSLDQLMQDEELVHRR